MGDTAEAKAYQDEFAAILGEKLLVEDEEDILAEFDNLEAHVCFSCKGIMLESPRRQHNDIPYIFFQRRNRGITLKAVTSPIPSTTTPTTCNREHVIHLSTSELKELLLVRLCTQEFIIEGDAWIIEALQPQIVPPSTVTDTLNAKLISDLICCRWWTIIRHTS